MSNPQTTVYKIVRYLLEEAPDNSRTWSIHLRKLTKLYSLPDPLDMMDLNMTKEQFKEMVTTKITCFHEKEMRERANKNSKMKFLNVSTTGLSGRSHPIISDIITTADVKALRPVLKCLTSDYYTYSARSTTTGSSGHCRLCPTQMSASGDTIGPTEDIVHVVAGCSGTNTIREKLLGELFTTASKTEVEIDLAAILNNQTTLTQFLLDNTSLNLDKNCRININRGHSL